jgi:uncharacterized protein YbcC (UPF0753/DUF2309 family)
MMVENTLWDDIELVCKRVAPLWDLPNYVAVNPFLGFAGQSLEKAAAIIHDGLDAAVLPSAEYYRARWSEGAFSPADLTNAARRWGEDPALLEKILNGERPFQTRPAKTVLTFAEQHDAQCGTSWEGAFIIGVTRWCAAQAAQSGAFPISPEGAAGLYSKWREAAEVDRFMEIAGLAGWRTWAKSLPPTAEEAIQDIAGRIELLPAERPAYFYRLLKGVYGWASFFRRSSWDKEQNEFGPLRDLLAIRLCADAAVLALARTWGQKPAIPALVVEEERDRLIFQEALEYGFAKSLLGKIALSPPTQAVRPAVQAVFCIDTRSELLRRHLEAVSPLVQTLGFAGFFGVSLSWDGDSARCPVLLNPSVRAWRTDAPSTGIGPALKSVQSAPSSAFTFVELLGVGYGLGLASDAAASALPRAFPEGDAPFQFQAGPEEVQSYQSRVDLAAGILKNLGLRTDIARLVLLCGHGGSSTNNPHAAGLDCGACGGHGGAINARVAASLLNDPSVRLGLGERGVILPDDTYFLPGFHNTAIDQVTLLDTAQVPPTHVADLAGLQGWLVEAGARTRAERAPALGLGRLKSGLLQALRKRGNDWSEVRPEWGLARNAAFLAARRGRTRGVDLEGRVFLNEYDWTGDPDNSILGLILSAPVVVASWINLQYFASTVDNDVFGCGSKALHNRVGTLGVVLGNGGDLRTGLPLQSVHTRDGNWYHEPLRLQVIVEAPTARIDAALAAHAHTRDLVENGWVRLYALDPDSRAAARWETAGWVTCL